MDRNTIASTSAITDGSSPPARVAWIETWIAHYAAACGYVATREGGVDRNDKKINALAARHCVATREGGVDRNTLLITCIYLFMSSPPARVAWIETSLQNLQFRLRTVATREGGVDRNFREKGNIHRLQMSPPARVAWIETPRKRGSNQ